MTHDLEAEGFVGVRSLVREPDRRALLQVHDGGGRCESKLHASVCLPSIWNQIVAAAKLALRRHGLRYAFNTTTHASAPRTRLDCRSGL